MTVEMPMADKARITEFFSVPKVMESPKSSRYHFTEKPLKTERLLDSLKEKTSRMMMGAKRKRKIRAV